MTFSTRWRAAAVFCAVFVGMAAPLAAGAQTPGGNTPPGRNLTDELGITPAQKAKMDTIRKKYQPQLVAIDKKYRPQFAALQKQLNAEVGPVAQKMDKEMGAVLTPAQRDKFKKIQAERIKMMQQQRGALPQQ